MGQDRRTEKPLEIREYYQSNEVQWLADLHDFPGIQSIGMVKATRRVADHRSIHCRYFLSSLPMDAQTFAAALRAHWSVENSLHWMLDMPFREDDSRMRGRILRRERRNAAAYCSQPGKT